MVLLVRLSRSGGAGNRGNQQQQQTLKFYLVSRGELIESQRKKLGSTFVQNLERDHGEEARAESLLVIFFATNKFQVLISFCILIRVCSRSYATLIFVSSLNIEQVDLFAFLSAIGKGLFDCCLFVGQSFSFFCRCWYWPLLLLWAIQRPVALTVGRLLVGISLGLRLT